MAHKPKINQSGSFTEAKGYDACQLSFRFDAPVIIPLNKGQQTIISAQDNDLARLKWNVIKRSAGYYAKRDIQKNNKTKCLKLHRVILSRMLGRELLRSEQVDHRDGDTLNNTRENLRLATNSQNQANRKLTSQNSSGYKGVSWHKQHGKWHSQLMVNGNRMSLGYYDDPAEAHRVYWEAAQKHFGEFARAK